MKDFLGLPKYDLITGKPLKNSSSRKQIGKPLRDIVWMKYMKNNSSGKCYCCKIRPIHYSDFQVGHNKSVAKGGSNNINNLRPICGPCNRGMGTGSIEGYRKKHFEIKSASTKSRPSKPLVRKAVKGEGFMDWVMKI